MKLLKSVSLVVALAAAPLAANAGGHTSDNTYTATADGEFLTVGRSIGVGEINYSASYSTGAVVGETYTNTEHGGVAIARNEGEFDYGTMSLALDEDSSVVEGSGQGDLELRTAVARNGYIKRDEEADASSSGYYLGGSRAVGDYTLTGGLGGSVGSGEAETASALKGHHVGGSDSASARNMTGVMTGGMASGTGPTSSVSDGIAESDSESSEVEDGQPTS